jgi:hypothetical protein
MSWDDDITTEMPQTHLLRLMVATSSPAAQPVEEYDPDEFDEEESPVRYFEPPQRAPTEPFEHAQTTETIRPRP